MNNNFDENNEFVRRPVRPEETEQNTRARTDLPRPDSAPRPMSERPPVRRVQSARPERQATPQSGVGRAQRPQVARPRQTPPEPAKRRETAEERPKKKRKGGFLRSFIIFILMLAALLALGFSLLLSSLHVSPEKQSTLYTLVYGDGSGDSLSSVNVNGVRYMNLTKLSEVCGFTVSGSKSSLRFTVDSGEYVEFMIGSVTAKINGDIVNMDGAALIRENENVWIPLDFAESYFEGIDFARDDEKMTVDISRIVTGEDDEGEPVYESVSFRIKGSVSVPSLPEDTDIGEMTDLEFVNDLSEYEQYMNPEDRDAYLILVNKTNTINADSIPEDLTPVENTRTDRAKEQMAETAEKALEALFKEMYSAGYTDVTVTSAYRSYNKQVSLFNTYLNREMSRDPSLTEAEAKEIVLTYSAYPGTSEHQTGLCCDMHNLGAADVAFANKEAYTWLRENCYKFGFILRYPEDKVDITGYSFEPWHYRFVGRYHATRMNSLGMCLEEYIEYLDRIQS